MPPPLTLTGDDEPEVELVEDTDWRGTDEEEDEEEDEYPEFNFTSDVLIPAVTTTPEPEVPLVVPALPDSELPEEEESDSTSTGDSSSSTESDDSSILRTPVLDAPEPRVIVDALCVPIPDTPESPFDVDGSLCMRIIDIPEPTLDAPEPVVVIPEIPSTPLLRNAFDDIPLDMSSPPTSFVASSVISYHNLESSSPSPSILLPRGDMKHHTIICPAPEGLIEPQRAEIVHVFGNGESAIDYDTEWEHLPKSTSAESSPSKRRRLVDRVKSLARFSRSL